MNLQKNARIVSMADMRKGSALNMLTYWALAVVITSSLLIAQMIAAPYVHDVALVMQISKVMTVFVLFVLPIPVLVYGYMTEQRVFQYTLHQLEAAETLVDAYHDSIDDYKKKTDSMRAEYREQLLTLRSIALQQHIESKEHLIAYCKSQLQRVISQFNEIERTIGNHTSRNAHMALQKRLASIIAELEVTLKAATDGNAEKAIMKRFQISLEQIDAEEAHIAERHIESLHEEMSKEDAKAAALQKLIEEYFLN